MPHGLPQKALQKIFLKNQKNGGGGAVAADQVQDGLGHGEIEEGQKEKKLAELLCATYAVFFFWWQQNLDNQL